VPGLRFVDAASGVLGIEWIDGKSVRFLLGPGNEGDQAVDDDNGDDVLTSCPDGDPLTEFEVSKGLTSYSHRRLFSYLGHAQSDALMVMVGTEIANMHLADIVHGDLTTSNMMLRHPVSIRHSAGIQQLVHRISRYLYNPR
jgi:TP53 regulating kinase and related kinases